MRNPIPIAALALVFAACASAGATGSHSGSLDVIGMEELEDLQGVSTAYDAVQRLRPRFLRGRAGSLGTRGASDPMSRTSSADDGSAVLVYLDGARLGGTEELRRIPVESVREIRYLAGRDATTKYGTGHGAGVIEVDSR